METILLTGGAGYIGSHTAVVLLSAGYQVVIVDDLSNSQQQAIENITTISGKTVTFYQEDIRDKSALTKIFQQHTIDGVIHFAGLKSVGESSEIPVAYFDVNVAGTISLIQVMQDFDCKRIIFSSSATVYGQVSRNPITEDFPTSATNPYGLSKLMNEQLLNQLVACDAGWQVGILRYFNPIGAHKSGLLGENGNGIPNNIMPYITQVAAGLLPELSVFGDDYDTIDGTGVRDYIHVLDLAQGHVAALKTLTDTPHFTVNLGTGRGYSVLELVDIFEKSTEQSVPYKITARRLGDVDACYADVNLAKTLLNWQAQHSVETACQDMWIWQTKK